MNLSNLNETLELGVSPLRYRLYIKFFAPKVTLQAGSYELRDSTTLEAFLRDTLTHPLHVDRTIRILPGWNMWDIDEYLASQGIAETGGFLATAQINFAQYQDEFAFLSGVSSLEWFLYPDTYRISPSATADTVIRVMLREFQKKIGDAYVDMDPRKAYEALILSSIVEREEPLDANQPIVAGILAKRVHEGIAMGADATVCYWYQKTQKTCTPEFIASVIYEKNPYNTRNMLGYPPTPISNVPVDTWKSVINPEVSPYYYYLHDSSWRIHYGRTNEEHNQNKARYLR